MFPTTIKTITPKKMPNCDNKFNLRQNTLCSVTYFTQNPDNLIPSRMVSMVTFSNSALHHGIFFFFQYGLYVINKFLLCDGYDKILQAFNSNLVLVHVRHYAFTLA